MFSTETALLEATNKWLWNIDNLLNGVIILDLKKAFDIIHYAILLGKLKIYEVMQFSPGSSPIYLTESNKRLLVELNLVSVM